MLTCTLTPYYLAFPDGYGTYMDSLDNAMNIIFGIDIIFNFFSAYYNEDY